VPFFWTDINLMNTQAPFSKNVEDYEFLRPIGEGTFSTIHLAREKSTNRICAIKEISKRSLIVSNRIRYALAEKDIMIQLSGHPYVIKLFATFHDFNSLYYVMEYCPNGDLQKYLSTFGALREDQVRFYCAELLLAIEYLHNKGIIHRDIKPENLLLDEKMHLKLCDFFTAKYIGNGGLRARSFVGTAEFLPPEIFQRCSVGKAGDIWAFGCVLYQLLCGSLPWARSDEYLTFQAIAHYQLTLPEHLSAHAKDLISKILVLDEEKRLTIPEIKTHPFFEGIDWEHLSSTTPPMSPLPQTSLQPSVDEKHVNEEREESNSKQIKLTEA
jgi:3-phosphoinositide dependent protein kinase-1